jgi:hypothetical protein
MVARLAKLAARLDECYCLLDSVMLLLLIQLNLIATNNKKR